MRQKAKTRKLQGKKKTIERGSGDSAMFMGGQVLARVTYYSMTICISPRIGCSIPNVDYLPKKNPSVCSRH